MKISNHYDIKLIVKIAFLALIFLTFSIQTAHAQEPNTSEGKILEIDVIGGGVRIVREEANAKKPNISEGKISEIRVREGVVQIDQENANYPEGCDNDAFFFIAEPSDSDFPLLPVLLTAYQSGEEVRLETSQCVENAALINEIILH